MPSTSVSIVGRPELAPGISEFSIVGNLSGYIAQDILRPILVDEFSGEFSRINIEALLQKHEKHGTLRAPNGGYARSSFKWTKDSYRCSEHGREETVDQAERHMYSSWLDLDQICAERAISTVIEGFEQETADLLFNPETFAEMTSPVDHEWADVVNATPIQNVESAVTAIWDATGVWANALVISERVFRHLRNCDQIIERIASSGAGQSTVTAKITRRQLAEVFDLEHILVSRGVKSDHDEGQDVSISSIWSDEYAMVCRIADRDDIKTPAVARAFFHSAESAGPEESFVVTESYEEPATRTDVIRARTSWDVKLFGAPFGFLLSNISSSAE